MSTQLIAFLSAITGAFLVMIGKYFTAKLSSGTENIIDIRRHFSEQIQKLEKRVDETNKELANVRKLNEAWIRRYWALYRWNMIMAPDSIPPDFHSMEEEKVEELVAKMYRENNPNDDEKA